MKVQSCFTLDHLQNIARSQESMDSAFWTSQLINQSSLDLITLYNIPNCLDNLVVLSHVVANRLEEFQILSQAANNSCQIECFYNLPLSMENRELKYLMERWINT